MCANEMKAFLSQTVAKAGSCQVEGGQQTFVHLIIDANLSNTQSLFFFSFFFFFPLFLLSFEAVKFMTVIVDLKKKKQDLLIFL